jgi:hypothetical protein
MIELISLDGEDVSSTADVMSGTPPGLTPGRHSLEFHFGTWGAKSGPGQTTTSTVYRSGNVSVTSTRTQTNTYVSYERTSDLLAAEGDFKPGRAYALVVGADGKPVIYDAGYSDWYWQWRVETKKPEETLVTIEDEHSQFRRQGPWPFVLVIDGDPSLFFSIGGEKEIVLSPGRHTFAVIDKLDPLSEAISASNELDIASGEAAIEIRGSGKEFIILDAETADAVEAVGEAAAEKAAEDTEAEARRAVSLSAKFPAVSGTAVGPGESILEVVIDYTIAPPREPLEIVLDDEPIMRSMEKTASMRFKIPNGPHKITAINSNKLIGQETTEAFSANSNLISATLTQSFLFSDDIEIEEKPLH